MDWSFWGFVVATIGLAVAIIYGAKQLSYGAKQLSQTEVSATAMLKGLRESSELAQQTFAANLGASSKLIQETIAADGRETRDAIQELHRSIKEELGAGAKGSDSPATTKQGGANE